MAKLVTGIFHTRSSSQLAVEDLQRHGYPQEDISVLATESAMGREFTMDCASKAPEGSSLGALVGGAVGGVVAALMAVGSIADPGLGLSTAQPVVSTLAGIGAGSLGGLLIGAIAGSGIPEYEASLVNLDKKKKGGFMLGVYCHPKRAAEARKLLDAAGATHIREKGVPTQAMRYRTAREYSGVES